jgi:uncharacterized protein (TIGR00645 family)
MERLIGRVLFASRWALVPLYAGLALFLLVLAATFLHEMLRVFLALPDLGATEVILPALSLIDLVLVASLLVMIMLSGYENFVGSLNITAQNLTWLGKLDIDSVKLKVAGAIVAISSINLLHAFMDVTEVADDKLLWLVIIQLTFVASMLALAVMDRITARGEDDG